MNVEDHIWKLAAKKLANEASYQESNELNELLSQHPDLQENIKLMFEWWQDGPEQTIDPSGYLLFKKILERIKDGDLEANSAEGLPDDQPDKK